MDPTSASTGKPRMPGWPMWKHRLAAVCILLACVGLWVGTALYRASSAEVAVRRRLEQLPERVRAEVTPTGKDEPDVRADRKVLLLNPFIKEPPVYLYLNGRRAVQLQMTK